MNYQPELQAPFGGLPHVLGQAEPPPPPPKKCWLSHVCTGGRQNKAQKMWLVSGLQDHRYLSVKIESKDARG